VSLEALLHQYKLPLLGDRFELAQSLVRAVLQLHSAGWLHKDFRSGNIVFFPSSSTLHGSVRSGSPTADTNSTYSLTKPYITGFEYARPDAPAEISEFVKETFDVKALLYRHPDYISESSSAISRPRFKRAYDVYALGCVLLEIGLWRSLESMLKDTYTPRKFRERLRESWSRELGGRCGERYMKVVIDCLGAGDEQEGEAEALREFVWNVVGELEGLNV
jgi:serine/threonine protein kinase